MTTHAFLVFIMDFNITPRSNQCSRKARLHPNDRRERETAIRDGQVTDPDQDRDARTSRFGVHR